MPERTWQLPIPFPPGSDGHPFPDPSPPSGKIELYITLWFLPVSSPLAAVFVYVILCEQPPSPQPRVALRKTPLLPITPPPNRDGIHFRGLSPISLDFKMGHGIPIPPEVHCCPLFNILPGPSSLTGPRPCPKQKSRPNRDGSLFPGLSPISLISRAGQGLPFPIPRKRRKAAPNWDGFLCVYLAIARVT